MTGGENGPDPASDPNFEEQTAVPSSDFALTPATDLAEESLSSKLSKAIANGSLQAVEDILNKDEYAVHSRYDFLFPEDKEKATGLTPLIHAACYDNEPIVKLLLERGADVNAVTSSFNTSALHLAAQAKRLENAKTLLRFHADTTIRNRDNWTVLLHAAWAGSIEICRLFLIDYNVDPNVSENAGWTPLLFAAYDGNEEIVRVLLEQGARADTTDRIGWNSLHYASWKGHTNIASFLLGQTDEQKDGSNTKYSQNVVRERINPNAQANDGSTALHIAAQNGFNSIVELLLLEDQIDITLLNDNYDTALFYAADVANYTIMIQLLRTKPYFPEDPVKSDACLATAYEQTMLDRALLNYLENASNDAGNIELVAFWAVANGRLLLLRKCMENTQFPVKSWCRAKATLLHVAAKYGHTEVIEELVKSGVDIVAQAYRDMNAFQLAGERGHRAALKTLLNSLPGTSNQNSNRLERIRQILKTNEEGKSTLALVVERRHRMIESDLWKEFLEFGANNEAFRPPYSEEACQILELAARFERPGQKSILISLLRQGNEPEDSASWTTLHWAPETLDR